MKNKFLFYAAVFALLLLSGCGGTQVYAERTVFALGTDVSVRVYDMREKEANLVIEKALARLYEIEATASAKMSESELYYVNQNAYEGDVFISDELFFLLKEGLFYSELTGGAFDIALGGVIELWEAGIERGQGIPSDDEIAAALENSGFEYLVLNENEQTVRFLKSGLKINLGAFAKGYAADEMKRVLLQNGTKNAVLNLGGDIITIGDKDGGGWLIGLADPLEAGEICAKLRIFDQAVVTSGNYERYFIYENKRYHHIIDRKTGYPSESGAISATIITESAMTADALSTALFVGGGDLIEILSDVGYILIEEDMRFTFSEDINIEFDS
ncbi:MAG: FAD:protein FMN transferase [Oscillospiraceae bacterium]|nr:FAD:protein FMN transferase [Oscillospiraceae bacterium]